MARRGSSRRGATMSPTARTDYARAAHKKDGETVVYSWVEWPDKETRAKGWEKMMTDERMKHDPANNPFDGARMIYGGFAPLVKIGRAPCRERVCPYV